MVWLGPLQERWSRSQLSSRENGWPDHEDQGRTRKEVSPAGQSRGAARRAQTPRGARNVESPAFSGLGVSTSGTTLSQSEVRTSQHGLKIPFVVRSRCQQVPHQPSMQPYLSSIPLAHSAAAERRELRRTVVMSPSGIITTLIGPFRVFLMRVSVMESPGDSVKILTTLSMVPSSVSMPLIAMTRSPSSTHMPGSSSMQTLRLSMSVLLPATTSAMPTPSRWGNFSIFTPRGLVMVTSKTAWSLPNRFTFLYHSVLVACSVS
mmetsp:Transcript_77297/g.167160  ORF Transcript_77297/g.167160 Transcript_77297/m.167160 type:complete len:262 (+) Transcript_77297:49-834(+)